MSVSLTWKGSQNISVIAIWLKLEKAAVHNSTHTKITISKAKKQELILANFLSRV